MNDIFETFATNFMMSEMFVADNISYTDGNNSVVSRAYYDLRNSLREQFTLHAEDVISARSQHVPSDTINQRTFTVSVMTVLQHMFPNMIDQHIKMDKILVDMNMFADAVDFAIRTVVENVSDMPTDPTAIVHIGADTDGGAAGAATDGGAAGAAGAGAATDGGAAGAAGAAGAGAAGAGAAGAGAAGAGAAGAGRAGAGRAGAGRAGAGGNFYARLKKRVNKRCPGGIHKFHPTKGS